MFGSDPRSEGDPSEPEGPGLLIRTTGSNPGCANREVENFSDELEPGSNPGRANRRFFRLIQKFANGPAVDRTGDLQDETAAVGSWLALRKVSIWPCAVSVREVRAQKGWWC